jgi:hypothetical protein
MDVASLAACEDLIKKRAPLTDIRLGIIKVPLDVRQILVANRSVFQRGGHGCSRECELLGHEYSALFLSQRGKGKEERGGSGIRRNCGLRVAAEMWMAWRTEGYRVDVYLIVGCAVV